MALDPSQQPSTTADQTQPGWKPGSTAYVYPTAAAPGESVGGVHQTSGLAGYPAQDFFAPAGTAVLAPESGRIVKLSGNPTTVAPTSAGGAFGLSEYLQTPTGHTYFITHLQTENVKLGESVQQGQILGQVADWSKFFGTPAHTHIGEFGGDVTALDTATKLTVADVAGLGSGYSSTGPGPTEIGSSGLYAPPGTTGYVPTHGDVVTAPPGAGGVAGATSTAARDTLGAVKSVGDLISWLTKTKNLIRVGEIMAGSTLILVGVVMVGRAASRETPVQQTATATKVVTRTVTRRATGARRGGASAAPAPRYRQSVQRPARMRSHTLPVDRRPAKRPKPKRGEPGSSKLTRGDSIPF